MKKLFTFITMLVIGISGMWADGYTCILFGNSTGVAGLTTDNFALTNASEFNETLSDGTAMNLKGTDGKFWPSTVHNTTWENTVAIEEINTALLPADAEIKFSADYFKSSGWQFVATGAAGSTSTLKLTLTPYDEGDKIVLYAAISSSVSPVSRFSASGLDNMSMSYATNTGDGFSTTQSFSSATGDITIVKIQGKLQSSKVVSLTSSTPKNGWQMIAYKFDYPHVTGSVTNNDKNLGTIHVTRGLSLSGEAKTLDIVTQTGTNPHSVYQNATNQTFTICAGQDIKVSYNQVDGMHAYMYIDYNNDGRFSPYTIQDSGIPTEGSELVSYTYYNGKNSKGESANNGNSGTSLPVFTIPSDLPQGTYRARYKLDCDFLDPYGSDASNRTDNHTIDNSGVIIDFIIQVGPKYTVTSNTKLSDISNYDSYKTIYVNEGVTLTVDVDDFDLAYISGAGNIILDANAPLSDITVSGSLTVNSGKTLTVTAENFDLTRITGEGNVIVSEKWTSNILTSPLNITYTGGAGTSESRVSINHNGDSATLTGADKTYYLTGSSSATQTTINFDETTVNYDNELGIGTAIYNINNTQITTPKFITSQGGGGRPAVVNLTGNSVITVTGNSNVDTNESSIMIGHWNGPSNVTLSGKAQIVAADAQLLVGKTANTQTITLNDNSNITAKGIKVSTGATGTNTLNLNGGSLNLGDAGITAYGNSMAVKVNGNTTITATAATLPLSQPITVASGKTLTINGGVSNATVTLNSLTNNGTVNFNNVTVTLNRSERDLFGYSFTNCTATLQFVETGDEYKNGGFTITNIPSGITVKVKKYDSTNYETVTPTDGTVTISHSVEVSGLAAWLDYTFNLSTKDKNTGTSGYVIKNAGNAGESGNDLTLDSDNGYQYTPSNSYNDDGTLKVMSTPYRTITWPTNYTVAVAGNVPDVENGCLVAFGTLTGGYLAILRGDASNKILLVKGKGQTTFNVITEMTAANATELSHLVVFTKNGNTFTVYLDGVQKAQVNYSETLGNGFQVGSLHGGIINTGIERVTYITDETKKAKVFAKGIRVYNYVISDDQMNKLKDEFPYTSYGGKYTRTISEDSNMSATNAWLNADTQGNVDIPVNAVKDEVTYYPDVEITTDAASTLTVNANMDTENIKFDGTGKLTIASDGEHNIHIYGSLTANGPISVKYGETNLSAVPVTIGESGSVEFDFSAYNFSSVNTPTDYPVTGNTADYGSKVTGVYPSDEYHTYTLAHKGTSNNYILTVEPSVKWWQDHAIALVTPYDNGGYVGTGLGKYTISLGETSYAEMSNFENAVKSWESLEDCVEPTISLNMPANGFYRFKSQNKGSNPENVDKYLHNSLYNGGLALNTTKDETTIFYVDRTNNTILAYANGRYLDYCNSEPTVGVSRYWTIEEGYELGKYALKMGSTWYASDWEVTDHITFGQKKNNELWAIEPVDELPLELAENSYTSFSAPVAVTIPANCHAYIAIKQNGNLIKMKEVSGNVPANTGLIIGTDASSNPTFDIYDGSEFAGCTGNMLVANVAASALSRSDNYFFGKQRSTGNYIFTMLSGDGDNYTLYGHKAYLPKENLASVEGARISIIWGDDDSTGLEELNDKNIELKDGKYYQDGNVVVVRNGVKYNVAGQVIK